MLDARTRFKPLAIRKHNIPLTELKIGATGTDHQLRTTSLNSQSSNGRAFPSSLNLKRRTHVFSAITVQRGCR